MAAVAAINGFHMWDPFIPLKYKGKNVPTGESDMSNIEFDTQGGLMYENFKRRMETLDHLVFPVRHYYKRNFIAGTFLDSLCAYRLRKAMHSICFFALRMTDRIHQFFQQAFGLND